MLNRILHTAFLTFLSCSICMADTIYVDQSGGSDYTTIQAGIDAAYAGDTVKVGPGVYKENVVIDKDLKLLGYGPIWSTIEASLDGISINANLTVEITGFTVTAGDDGIDANRDNVTCIIKNCIIVSCGGNGIVCYNKNAPTISIFNNSIMLNAKTGVSIVQSYGSDPSQANLQGNIIYSNGQNGISLVVRTENIAYNNVYNNTNHDYNKCDPGIGDIAQNPRFIDENSGNFALRSDSPCIDSGRPGATHNDPNGTRNDMGAFAGPGSAAFWPYIAGGPTVSDISVTPASVPQGGTITIDATGRVK